MYRALRSILKRPAFAIPAIAGLVVGIGASTAVFSAFSAIELESMGFRDPARLAAIWLMDPAHNQPQVELSFGDWQAWQRSGVADVALASSVNLDYSIYFDAQPEHVDASTVTGNFFHVLGAKPLAGRFLDDEDDQPGAPLRIVISNTLFQSRFHGDFGVVGRQVRFADVAATVVGIARPEFDFPRDVAVWVPLRASWPDVGKNAWVGVFRSVARLAPGVSTSRLEAALRQDSSRPSTNPVLPVLVKPIREEAYGSARLAVLMLMGAVLLLLLIACTNAANLVLALHAERADEIAVRAALGAGRWRIVRLLVSESAAIAALSGIGGLVLARGAIALFARFAPPEMPGVARITLNWPVALFGIGLTAATLLVFSLGPALFASGFAFASGLRTVGGRSQSRLRHWLIGAEVALAAMLVLGGGLLLRSFQNLSAVDPGFHSDNVLTFRVTTEAGDQATRRATITQVLERVRALPGVESAAAILLRPLSGSVGWDTQYTAENQTPGAKGVRNPSGNYEAISPGYFHALGIPLIAGRDFDAQDNDAKPGVVIVNQSTAKGLWPDGRAVGSRLRTGGPKNPWMTVIGVAADVRYREWEAARPDIYVPYLQRAQHRSDFVVKTHGDPWALAVAVRQAVFAVDKNQPISNVTTMDALVDRALSRARLTSALLTAVAFCAAALAAIGIYGLLSFSVQQRTREIGVRAALGASPRDVAGLISRDVLRFAIAGLAVGLAGAAIAASAVRSQFYGVGAFDVVTYVVTALTICAIALLAAALPAWRASSIDPATALRG